MRPHWRLSRLLPALALTAALTLSAAAPPCRAHEAGDLGAGVYQATSFLLRSTVAYPTLSIWAAPQFMFQFGFTFSTADAENFGFMTRAAFPIYERGDASLMLGGLMDIFEVGAGNQTTTFVGFAPIGGIHYDVTDDFTFILDALPFAIGHIKNNTDAAFFTARLGATYWFK